MTCIESEKEEMWAKPPRRPRGPSLLSLLQGYLAHKKQPPPLGPP